MSRPTFVVAAVCLRDDAGRVLTVRKRGTESFMLPGGKIEEGEDAAAALEREIVEELGAHLRVGERVCPDDGLWWPVLGGRVMGVWLAEVAPSSSAPRAGTSHLEACWVPISELGDLPWIVADLPIVEAVAARCAR